MSIAYETPGFAAAEDASLQEPDWDYRSAREQSMVERQLEQMADDEVSAAAPAFRDWLADNPDYAIPVAVAAVYWPARHRDDGSWMTREEINAQAAQNVAEAVAQMTREYVAYRVNTFSDDDRADALRDLRDGGKL